jgi:nucleotide-binding universal stress UspA family protein
MKRILVPTDFTELAEVAVSSAATLAKKTGGEIVLLHVYEKEPDPQAESKLEVLREKDYMEGIDVSYEIRGGDPIDEIVNFDATIIVIAGRELKGIKGFFSHTTAEKVAKHATCPVITVKTHTNLGAIKSIVYPTDMRSEQQNLIDDLLELQKLYDANLHIVKVFEDDFILKRDMEKRLKDFAEFNDLESYSVTAIEGNDEADEIMRFADELGAQMIAMATHDRYGLEKLIGGYISGEILKESKIAIWTKVVN